jgi:hypothetical protein
MITSETAIIYEVRLDLSRPSMCFIASGSRFVAMTVSFGLIAILLFCSQTLVSICHEILHLEASPDIYSAQPRILGRRWPYAPFQQEDELLLPSRSSAWPDKHIYASHHLDG